MPRQARLSLPDYPHHVIQRGVNRCAIFMTETDRRQYYRLLQRFAEEHQIPVHAYVFMGNHVHLLLTPKAPGALSKCMRRLGQCYVQAFNRRHHRCGPLWQGRFKSCIVNTDHYLLTVYRYIELNPVRAAMVARPEAYPWSSVHANLGLRSDMLVTPHPSFRRLAAAPASRVRRYRELLDETTSASELERIRAYLQQERALGDRRFQTMVEKTLGRQTQTRPRGRPTRA